MVFLYIMSERLKRSWKGTWIPKEIWTATDLTWMEKCIWGEIHNLEDEIHGGCFASNQYIADCMRTSAGSIANSISTLRKNGYVQDVGFDGRKRVILAITKRLMETSPSGEPCDHQAVNIYTSIDTSLENTPIIPCEGMVGNSNEYENPTSHQNDLPAKQKHSVSGRVLGDEPEEFQRIVKIFTPKARMDLPRPDNVMRAWKKAAKYITLDDVKTIEYFYNMPKSKDCDETWNRKTAVAQLINQWIEQVEKAQSYMEKHSKKAETNKPNPAMNYLNDPKYHQ